MITVGIDEAGRGCLCGPVCAASVAYSESFTNSHLLADSKTLSPDIREVLAIKIRSHCIWGIGWAYPHEIDELNIHHASLLAMQRAFSCMCLPLTIRHPNISPAHIHVKVDGKFCPSLHSDFTNIEAVIKGDSKIDQIKAASILAKTARDAHMKLLSESFPHFLLDKHKGYPTTVHKHAILRYGCAPIYRYSFKGVHRSR